MSKLARRGLVDVLLLDDQCKRSLRTARLSKELSRFPKRRKRVEIVRSAMKLVGSPSWIAPDPILLHRVPYVASATLADAG